MLAELPVKSGLRSYGGLQMDSKIKEAIKRISKTDISHPVDVLGNILADILFKKDKSALFVNSETGKVLLLLPTEETNNNKHKAFLLLTELVAVLQNFESQGIIYVVDDYCLSENLFYQGKDIFEKDQRPGVYKVSNNMTLKQHDDLIVTLNAGDKELMTSIVVYDQVGALLVRYLSGIVLPTKSLKEYVKMGFKTREERNTQLGLRYSVISVTIAVLIAVLSPFLSVQVANRYGFSTIKQEQMDSLLKISKPVYVVGCKDSVHQSGGKNADRKSPKRKNHGK